MKTTHDKMDEDDPEEDLGNDNGRFVMIYVHNNSGEYADNNDMDKTYPRSTTTRHRIKTNLTIS